MSNTLNLVETRTINDVLVNGYYGAKEAWFTRNEIGSALEYSDPAQAILLIHKRHKERLDLFSRPYQFDTPSGVQEGYVYNIRGVFEICRWSKQPKANMVMDALYDMAESVARTGFYSLLPDQELIDLLVKRQSENPTFLREAAVDLKSKKALEQLTQDAQLRELWSQRTELPQGEYKSKLNVICNGNFTLLNILIEVLGAVAEQERTKTKQRQVEGIAAMPVVNGKRVSIKTGNGFGRPKTEIDPVEFEKISQKQKDGKMTVAECCRELGISRSTWYNLRKAG